MFDLSNENVEGILKFSRVKSSIRIQVLLITWYDAKNTGKLQSKFLQCVYQLLLVLNTAENSVYLIRQLLKNESDSTNMLTAPATKKKELVR